MAYYNYGSFINKIEFHYFLNDGSHSMDALIRNSCEKELLAIILQISNVLELELEIETIAHQEGGLREFYELICEKARGNKYILGIISGIIITVVSHYLTKDFERERLEKEKLQLEIQKLKHELSNIEDEREGDKLIQDAVFIFSCDPKVIKHRSNYYSILYKYTKVSKVKSQAIDYKGEKKGIPAIVEKREFESFILDSDELNPEVDNDAVIEIVSPVLKKGKYKWKGIYLKTNETISFYMKDKEFKNRVVSDAIPFQNGSRIKCELEIEKKLNEIGEIKESGYSVLLVKEVISSEYHIETEHSKRIYKEREALKNQLSLDLLNDKKKE